MDDGARTGAEHGDGRAGWRAVPAPSRAPAQAPPRSSAPGSPAPGRDRRDPAAADPWTLLQRTQRRLAACTDDAAVAAELAAALTAAGAGPALVVTAPREDGICTVLAATGPGLPEPGAVLREAPAATAAVVPLTHPAPEGGPRLLAGPTQAARPLVGALAGAAALALARIAEIRTRRGVEQDLAATRALLAGARSLGALGSWEVRPDGRVLLDEPMREMLGLPAGTASIDAGSWSGAVHPDDRGPLTVPGGESATYPFRVTTATGEVRTLLGWSDAPTGQGADGRPVRGMALDLSGDEAHIRELVRLAHSDGLTGLPNRTLLDARLAEALHHAHPTRSVVLVLLDLDNFTLVNDSLGHQVGDTLLRGVADRLRAAAPAGSTLARLGGDQFVLCLPGVDRPDSAQALAHDLVRRLRAPHRLPGLPEPLVCTASAGVAVAAGGTAEDLFRSADMALHRAKDNGRDRCALYDRAMRADAQARHDSERRLRRALRDGGLRLVWQPIVDLRDRHLVAAECLVRLQDPDEGLLGPAAFVDTAEDTGLIVDVDSWVLDAALDQLQRWRSAGSDLQVSVNVSGRTLEHPAFAHRLAHSVQRTGGAGRSLLAEVTERTLIDLTAPTRASLHELRSAGARVGLDDFGTGYSSLAYLQRFPLSFLKIDRSFVTPLGTGRRADAVVEALIALAHAHGMLVTAEGVETELQAQRLLQMGCDRAQGWLFGRPVAAAELFGGPSRPS